MSRNGYWSRCRPCSSTVSYVSLIALHVNCLLIICYNKLWAVIMCFTSFLTGLCVRVSAVSLIRVITPASKMNFNISAWLRSHARPAAAFLTTKQWLCANHFLLGPSLWDWAVATLSLNRSRVTRTPHAPPGVFVDDTKAYFRAVAELTD